MDEGRVRRPAIPAPGRGPVTSLIQQPETPAGRCYRGWRHCLRGPAAAGLPVWRSRGVGHGTYGAGEVHPPGGRRQPPPSI